MQAAVVSCREFLRNETSDAHLATDTRLSSAADLADTAGYALFLQVMGLTLTRFGADLDSADRSAGLSARSAALVGHIDDDLDVCGAQFQKPKAAAGHTGCHSFAAGVGYALEGSALGAEVLRRRVLTGSRPGVSTRYFDALRDNRRDRWRRYCIWLDGIDRTPEGRNEAARGAADVFHYINQCLDRAHEYT